MTVSPMASATTSRPNLRPEPMIQSIDGDLPHRSPAVIARGDRTATNAKRVGIGRSSAHGLVPPGLRLNPWFDSPPDQRQPRAPAPAAGRSPLFVGRFGRDSTRNRRQIRL